MAIEINFNERIDNCFDSHVHWAATGEFAERLDLRHLASAGELLQIPAHHQSSRQGWILGFGWDESSWPDRHLLTHTHLNRWNSELPVLLSRVDGHTVWVNTAALIKMGLLEESGAVQRLPVLEGGVIDIDSQGTPTGVFRDRAAEWARSFVPAPQASDLRRYLLKGVQSFHAQGFTHIRDLGGDEQQWHQALLLDQAGLLNIGVESLYHVKSLADMDAALEFAAKASVSSSPNVRFSGLKIFLDGSLGSETALLSQDYLSGGGRGLQLYSEPELKDILRRCFERQIPVAVHALGDGAAELCVRAAVELKEQGRTGVLNLEHVEILQPETIAGMEGLQVTCHLQPSHWLSDKVWLDQKLGPERRALCFPWRRLQEQKVPFFFGSDSPVEEPSVSRTLIAIQDAQEQGIPRLLGSPLNYFSHPDPTWTPNTFTVFENGRPSQIVFRGEHLN